MATWPADSLGRPVVGPPLVTPDQMRALEAAAVAHGTPLDTLMADAGRAVARWLDREDAGGPRRLLCLVGPGNNGDDGLVAGAHLARAGWQVAAALWRRRADPDWPLALARAVGVRIWSADADPDRTAAELAVAPRVLDALFGIGHSRPFTGPLAQLLGRLQAVPRARIVALDTPSGVDAGSGAVDPAAPMCGVTLTLGAPKVGLVRFPAAERTGRLITLDIGLPPASLEAGTLRLIDPAQIARLLPPRPLSANKGTFGKVAVVAGSAAYPGAAALTAGAAVRAGAGLVTLVATRSVGALAAAHVREATHVEAAATATGGLAVDGLGDWFERIAGYDALAVGPGFGRDPASAELVRALLGRWLPLGRPAVVDADGLNALAERPSWWRELPPGLILTPHPGEMARLVGGGSAAALDADRFAATGEAARQWRQIVVLKGAFTAIADPDGRVAVSPVAAPALATAGTGDVLTGVIVALLAQGLQPWAAAVAGVTLHALAGVRVADEVGSAGAAAADLLPRLPAVRRTLLGG